LGLGSLSGTNSVTAAADLPAASAASRPEATAALDWLSAQLAANGSTFPGFAIGTSPARTDWGLTADVVLSFIAAGQKSDPAPQAAANQLILNLSDFTTYEPQILGVRLAGPTAKVLLISESLGLQPSLAPGLSLEQELRSLMVTTGPQAGRFADRNPSSSDPLAGDSNNGFGQALAVLGLSLTDSQVPAEAVDFLVNQQCPNGGFRLIYTVTPNCISNDRSDTDATALAIQGLLSVERTPSVEAALSKALGWLLAKQDPNTGGFGGTGSTAAINANSTGLSAQALRAAGQLEAAERAATWITSSLQLNGAIAYTPTARAAAVTSGIASNLADQWRRATTQGVLALGLAPFAPAVEAELPTVPPTTVPPTTAPTNTAPLTPAPFTPAPTGEAPAAVLGTQATATSLAFTGSPSKPLIFLGIALMMLGLAAVAVSQKSKPLSASRSAIIGIGIAGVLSASILHAPPVAAAEGACTTAAGVTVVIDFQDLGGGVSIRCVSGEVDNGFAALTAAGINFQTATRAPGFLCKIAGLPAAEQCIQPAPTTAYWSYWLANRGGTWCYSSLGAGNILPPPGSVQGWSFSLNRTDSDAPAPRVSPPPALSGSSSSLSVGGGCDSAAVPISAAAEAPALPLSPAPPLTPAQSAATTATPSPAPATPLTPAPSPTEATAAPTAPPGVTPSSSLASSSPANSKEPENSKEPGASRSGSREQSAPTALSLNQETASTSSPVGLVIAVLLLLGIGTGAVLLRRRATRP
jgi:prenyltransferase beta subunit